MSIHKEQLEFEEVSNKKRYFSIIESLLFVSGDPLSINSIAYALECSKDFAIELMELFITQYNDEGRGIKIIKLEDTYQFVTKIENSDYVQRLLKTNSRQSLSQAALEVLAIIAYKQPITRVEIEEIRGVKSDRAIYTLVEKQLIKENGRKDIPGRPILYSTTREFLKYFQLEDLKELPNLKDFTFELSE